MLRFLYRIQKYKTSQISTGKSSFNAILADSMIKKMIGLMFRKSLDKETTMFFDFGRGARHGIWMRNMRFSIDAIWLSENKIIVDMVKNIPTLPQYRTYRPAHPARYLIETNAGFINRNKIKLGQKVKIKTK